MSREIMEWKLKTNKTETENIYITIRFFYTTGGVSFADYRQIPRSYRITVKPETIEKRGSVVLRSFTAFSGYTFTIEEAKRFSAKRADSLKNRAYFIGVDIARRVAKENGIEVYTEEEI